MMQPFSFLKATASTRWCALSLCTLLCLVAPDGVRAQQELITNGGFETGTFAGFTQTNQDNGSFLLLAPGSDTPIVAPDTSTFQTAANPLGGSFFAVTASGNPGTHALLQNFTVPFAVTSLNLSFQMFVNDQSFLGPIVDPSGLDNRTGGVTDPTTGAPLDNQHARVDILTSGAGDFSTASADIVQTLYGPTVDNPGGVTPNPYLTYQFNLLGALTPGQTYRLRFAEVDNLGSINLGVDNISLLASTPAAVPEPGSFALLGGLSVVGFLGLAANAACANRRCVRGIQRIVAAVSCCRDNSAVSRCFSNPATPGCPIGVTHPCLPNTIPCRHVSNNSKRMSP